MIDPGKEPEIRQLENGILKGAKLLPNLVIAVLKIFGRVGKGIYNGLLGRTAVKPESKEAADQKNKKEHLLVRAAVGLTKTIGAIAKGLSYLVRGSYNTVQKLRGKELEKITNEPSLSRESSLRRENTVSRGNLARSNSLPNLKNSVKSENLAKDNLKRSVSFTEKQRRFSDIQTYGRKKSARINAMKKKQEALTSQRTQPVRSAGI